MSSGAPIPTEADQRASDKAILAAKRVRWMRNMAKAARHHQDRYDAQHYALQYEAEVITLADAIIGRAASSLS